MQRLCLETAAMEVQHSSDLRYYYCDVYLILIAVCKKSGIEYQKSWSQCCAMPMPIRPSKCCPLHSLIPAARINRVKTSSDPPS